MMHNYLRMSPYSIALPYLLPTPAQKESALIICLGAPRLRD
jgi:hypothetical protein